MHGRVPVLLWHCRKASERRSLWSAALIPSSHYHQGLTLTQSQQPLKQANKSPLTVYRSPGSPSPLRPYQGCWPTFTPATLGHRGYFGVCCPLEGLGQSTMASYPFFAEYAKRGQAKCKTCKEKCEKGILRLGKITSNPFSSGDTMKIWYHTDCLFESFKKARATTKKMEDPETEIENWDEVEPEDRKKIMGLMDELQDVLEKKAANTPKKQTPKKQQKADTTPPPSASKPGAPGSKGGHQDPPTDRKHKDNSFREFRRLCAAIADEPSYLSKTQLVSDFLTRGSGKDGFKGDLRLWVKLLLPGEVKRVYNLQSKQLLKLYSQVFNTSLEEMMEDLEQGDVAETVRKFFEESQQLPPVKKSILSLQDVDEALEELASDEVAQLRLSHADCSLGDIRGQVSVSTHAHAPWAENTSEAAEAW